MKNIKTTLLCTSLLLASGTASAGWLDFFNQADETAETVKSTTTTINNTVQTSQAINNVSQVGLVDTLVKQLGVSQTQAQGGTGALFQIAKNKMTESDFSQVSQSVPGMDGILAAAPKPQPASATGNLLGTIANATGNSSLISGASVVNTFQQLDMSKGMVSQFTPVIIDYVKTNGGELTANLLKTALTGL